MNSPSRFAPLFLILATLFTSALLAADPAVPAAPATPAGKAKHVVIVVMDGLRPDSVTAEDMPTLDAMGKRGTFFTNHHPVYLSTTEVNGAALATGMKPANTGITGNVEYRPDVDLLSPVDTQGAWSAWKGDELTGGKWLRAATMIERVRASGGRAVICGTKGVALLWDRSLKNRTPNQPIVVEGRSIPGSALDPILPEFGPMPPSVHPKYFANRAQDHWTARVLAEKVWADDSAHGGGVGSGIPALSVLWVSEPDYAQHGAGPGSKTAKSALRSSDDCLKKVLETLEVKKMLDQTDVMVVSDHGFSTIAATIDVAEELSLKGFKAAGAFLEAPDKDTAVVIGLGGSVSINVIGRDPATIKKLVDHIQTTPWAGVIFTKEGIEGTFKLSDSGIDAPEAADIIVSMRWADAAIEGHMPGVLFAEGLRRGPGQGMHGSLSKFDMHNTLIAAGPDFKKGFQNTTPSGNSDVAPTVLKILGVATKEPLDGRVLSEALEGGGEAPKVETAVMKAGVAGEKKWQQYMKVSTVEGKWRYYDEGNAGEGK